MQAYLRDEVSETLVQEIEAEMERDPLYHLAMEALAQSPDNTLEATFSRIQRTEEDFPQLLLSAKENFITYLESAPSAEASPSPSLKEKFSKLPNWQKWFGALTLLLLVASLTTLPLLMSGPSFHKDPSLNLVADGDQRSAITMLQECEQSLGIGAGREVTFKSAIVGMYDNGNYAEAIHQFKQLSNIPDLGDNCQAYLRYFLANSYMMEGDYSQAIVTFKLLTENTANPASLINAAHWYLGNLALETKDFNTATAQFEQLLASDSSAKRDHVQSLFQSNYLQEAQKYLYELKQ